MTIFGKKEKDENSPVVQPPPIQKEMTEAQQKNSQKFAAKATAKDASKETTYFGKNLKITGTVSGEGSSIIQGSFEGELNLNGQLRISQGARIKGNLKASDIYVNGNVEGTLAASKKVHVDNTARIKGRIITPKISVQEGSVFDGEIQMSKPSTQLSKPATPELEQASTVSAAHKKK